MYGLLDQTSHSSISYAPLESRQWAEVEQAKEVKSPLQCPIPRCRYGHSICYFGGRLYMYGGRNDDDLSFHTVECYDIGVCVCVCVCACVRACVHACVCA